MQLENIRAFQIIMDIFLQSDNNFHMVAFKRLVITWNHIDKYFTVTLKFIGLSYMLNEFLFMHAVIIVM